MARLPSYSKTDFTESAQLLAYDLPNGQTVLIPGDSLIDYIGLDDFNEELINRVQWFSTNEVAQTVDLPVGRVIYTAGGSDVADGDGGHYIVVASGGSVTLNNGNELQLLPLGDLSGADASGALVDTSTGLGQDLADALDDRATATFLTKSVAGGSDVTLTSDESKAGVIELTGAITADINVIVPDSARQWLVINSTTGSFDVTFKTATGTGVVIPQGLTERVRSDGTDVVRDYAAYYETAQPKSIDISGTTNVNVTLNQIIADFINLDGASGSDHDVTWPNDLPGLWVVQNNDTAGNTLTVKTATGAGVALTGGGRKYLIRSDGTDMLLVATLEPQFGWDQSWQDVTSSRSAGVEYTNTTGKAIGVSVTNFNSDVTGYIVVSGLNISSFRGATGTGDDRSAFAIVPPGATYEVTSGASFNLWMEFRT